MQRLYWRPAGVSRRAHVLVAILAVGALFAVERFQAVQVQPDFEIKVEAANHMRRGLEVLRTHRVRHVARIDRELDPAGSGIIGSPNTSTTTSTGSLEAKRTTANPNWAAVVVSLLRDAGAREGDLVAVGVSGSFPALNLAALVAAEVLGLETVTIAGTGASSFGANFPTFTWLDMERILAETGVISRRSVAASLGGSGDRALGVPASGRRRLRRAIERNGVPFLETEEDRTSIDQRLAIYTERAEGRRYVAYVNVGGSLVSIGPKSVKRLYRPGLTRRADPRAVAVDSVMMRFLRDGVPVINLSKVVPLAEQYGLPVEPRELPQVGEGPVFERREHDRRLVAALLVGLLLALYGLLKLELGARITALGGRGGPLKPMA